MKKRLIVLLISSLLLTLLAGCAEKKTFVRPEEPLADYVTGAQGSSSQAEEAAADQAGSGDASEAAGKAASDESAASDEAAASETAATETAATDEAATTEDNYDVEADVLVTGSELHIPEPGATAFTPSDAEGFFAVDGRLIAQSTIGIQVDPPGILNCDIYVAVLSDSKVKAKIEIYKDGQLLSSYEEEGLALTRESQVINAVIKTHEDTVCSGTYTAYFYLNGIQVATIEQDVTVK